MQHNFSWTIQRGEETFEIEIEGSYRFGSSATWTDPADPDEFELEKAYLGKEEFTLTDEEYEAIEEWAYNNPPDDDYDYYEW